jgi:hypothetical protein
MIRTARCWLATAALPALAAGATANASDQVLLMPGTWTLYVLVDAPPAVVESDGTCGGCG